MEIRNLQTFLKIVDTGSFSRAAEQLGYTQSTVSYQIRLLEEELNCKLFERVGKQNVLTDKGEKLLKHAISIDRNINEMTEDFGENAVIKGTVHMFSADSILEKMMLFHYQEFFEKYPDIKIVFSTGDTVDMINVLDKNEADVIFTLSYPIFRTDYVIEGQSPVELHFVCGSGNPLAESKRLSITDILDYPFLLTEKGMSYRKILDDYLAEKSIEIAPVLETGRTDIILKCLMEGKAIGFLPDYVTEEEVKSGRLVRLDITDVQLTIQKQLIRRRDKWMSKALTEFISFVVEHEFSW